MKQLADAKHIEFAVVFMPEIAPVFNRDGFGELYLPHKYFMDECAKLEIGSCIDLMPSFSSNPKAMFVMDDGHLSPAGASTAAHAVGEHLRAKGVLR